MVALSHALSRFLPVWRSRRPGLSELFALGRQRHALSRLDDAALDDIGISRDEAETEAARPFWDAPAHWSAAPRRQS
ncbi:protein of unknown function [Lutimaribacter pacificus]|uniref:YjiS-like domain-containing protein n=1 Tax=Lutimaribacter pacificus TaxID=391948 RepID=A0A1H0H4V8_9RHOB|nr:DUF1127 domain-containing protein [Lutimaribacter pacificus]SDO14162.1 protein of unknown function [Lutimaribacter pacificus]SHJ96271.1 protein of unknown function [Lutimaribacter pacificus]